MGLSFGMLSTYPPTQCGLATFSVSLADALTAAGCAVGVVRLVDVPERLPLGVVGHLVRDGGDARRAAGALDAHPVVVVQHEFGVYGGPDGEDVMHVLDNLTARVIVVVHTVLAAPSAHQRTVLQLVVDRADAVVVMSMTARDRLLIHYEVDAAKISIIPHGAATGGGIRSTGRSPGPARLLTWGLLGPGKGVETAIDALSHLRGLDPAPQYAVVGQTHPRVLSREGEAYRTSLAARASALGVGDMVSFHPTYLDAGALNRMVAEADVVILPYESREQVTSGVLIEAVAAGKPVVATAFPHAVEMLASGAGLVVPHDDPVALARAVRRVLTEPGLVGSMTRRGGALAHRLSWPKVARQYRALAASLVGADQPVPL